MWLYWLHQVLYSVNILIVLAIIIKLAYYSLFSKKVYFLVQHVDGRKENKTSFAY